MSLPEQPLDHVQLPHAERRTRREGGLLGVLILLSIGAVIGAAACAIVMG